MNTPAFENLDLACAKAGKNIAEKPSKNLENIIMNAIAVLEEQGLYALFLFLEKNKNNEKQNVSRKLHEFLKATPQQTPLLSGDTDSIFLSLQKMAEDIDNLLLAHDIVRKSLVYARYHAQTSQKNEVRT